LARQLALVVPRPGQGKRRRRLRVCCFGFAPPLRPRRRFRVQTEAEQQGRTTNAPFEAGQQREVVVKPVNLTAGNRDAL
jgi:hypothetical protein